MAPAGDFPPLYGTCCCSLPYEQCCGAKLRPAFEPTGTVTTPPVTKEEFEEIMRGLIQEYGEWLKEMARK